MKIIELRADNFKRLKAVEIKPDGSLIVISGRNAQGKSSVLDAIWAALGGKKASPPKPIREGEELAKVTLDLGDYIVSRIFTKSDSYLTLTSSEGANISNPQKLLDSLIASISFDPLEFVRMKPQMQAWNLARTADVDFKPLNEERRQLYEQRSEVNRDKTKLEGAISEMKKADLEIEKKSLIEEVPIDELMLQYTGVKEQHTNYERASEQWERRANLLSVTMSDCEALKKRVVELESKIAVEKKGLSANKLDIDKRKEKLPDIQAIEDKISKADSIKEHNHAIKNYAKTEQERFEKAKQSQELTEQIAGIDRQKTELVTSAKLPLDGLTFDENGVFFNGVPFQQCSSSEQLKVSTVLAMNLNPKLRVIRINDGSLLDKDNLAALESIAIAKDFQVWIERVGEAGDIGIIIEDGQIKQDKEK